MDSSHASAQTAIKFARFLVSPTGRKHLARGELGTGTVVVCAPHETLRDVLTRVADPTFPVVLAVDTDEGLHLIRLDEPEATSAPDLAETVAATSTVSMFVEYLNASEEAFHFHVADSPTALTARDFTLANVS